jgi:hypothetical protein
MVDATPSGIKRFSKVVFYETWETVWAYYVPAALKQRQENLEGLLLQLDQAALFPQLTRPFVHFE